MLEQLIRVLEERGIPIEPVLSVVTAAGTENVFMGVGTLSGRVELLVPSHADVLRVVAPAAALPVRSMLLVSAHGTEPLAAAVVIGLTPSGNSAANAPPAMA